MKENESERRKYSCDTRKSTAWLESASEILSTRNTNVRLKRNFIIVQKTKVLRNKKIIKSSLLFLAVSFFSLSFWMGWGEWKFQKSQSNDKVLKNLIRITVEPWKRRITLKVFPVLAWSRWRDPIDVCWRIKLATSSNSLLSTSPSPFKSNILNAISKCRREAETNESKKDVNWNSLLNLANYANWYRETCYWV